MYCVNCGKKIDDGVAFCPECGAAQKVATTQNNANDINQAAIKKTSYDTMCIVGLVISGISLLVNLCGIVGIAGVVVSVIGLINCSPDNKNGKIFAIIGIVIGGFSIVFAAIALIFLLVFV